MGKTKKKRYNQKNISIVLIVICVIIGLVLISSLISFLGSRSSKVNVAVIPVTGIILTEGSGSLFLGGVTSSKDIVRFIEKADQDCDIDAIVLEVNSPGGSPVASKEVVNALKRSKKPSYALIRELGTSAAYWISSAVNKKIVANELSIVGNVGVISSYLEFSGLLSDYNVTYNRLVAGEHKDVGDPFRPLTGKEKEMLQDQLKDVHEYYLGDILENRKITNDENIEEIKTAMFFIGIKSKELGLVDELGDKKTLENIIKKDFNAKHIRYKVFVKKSSWTDLFSKAMFEGSFYIGQGIGKEILSTNNMQNNFKIFT